MTTIARRKFLEALSGAAARPLASRAQRLERKHGLGVRDHRNAHPPQEEGRHGRPRRKRLEPARVSARSRSGRHGNRSRYEIRGGEPPPETTRIRIHDAAITCFAPVYIAEALLNAEGFTDVQYIKTPLNEGPTKALAEGKIDITQNDTAGHLMELDAGAPVVVLGGIHTGCWELFVNDSVRTLRDLKGKTVAPPPNAAAVRPSSPVWPPSSG